MGFIEEGRQLIQDFVTPEIRSIDARLTALEKHVESLELKVDKRFDAMQTGVDKRFDAVDKRFDAIDKRFDAVDKRFESVDIRFDSVDKRFESLENKIDRNHTQVLDAISRMETYTLVMERLARLESKIQNVA